MGSRPFLFKSTVAAWLAAIGLSGSLVAQTGEPVPLPDLATPDAVAPDVPEAAPQPPEEREADLLRQLAEAESPDAASRIDEQLRGLWSRSGSAAIDLLLRRGRDALEGGAPDRAIDHFTAALDHAPDFAEAYVGRASAYYLTNRAGPAIDDLRQALVLNPNHWEALQGFAVILEEVGRPEDALELWRRVHDMHPQNPQATQAVARLERSLDGQTL